MFLVIHNPLSNNKKSKKTTAKYVKFFQKNKIAFQLRSTLKIENLNQFLDEHPDFTDVLYLGGDGTINYLINHVDLDKMTQNLYFAQSGSGNDFLRVLKPIQEGLMTIGGARMGETTTRFINGCGLGLDGHVGFFVNKDKKKNKMSYFVNTFRALRVYNPSKMEVVVDGVVHTYDRTYLVAVQNGRYFGGGMQVAPKGDPTSDSFEVIVAHTLKRWQVFPLFMTIYLGLHVYLKKYVSVFTGQSIRIRSVEPKYFQAEGEVQDSVSTFDVAVVGKRAIRYFDKKRIAKEFKKA